MRTRRDGERGRRFSIPSKYKPLWPNWVCVVPRGVRSRPFAMYLIFIIGVSSTVGLVASVLRLSGLYVLGTRGASEEIESILPSPWLVAWNAVLVVGHLCLGIGILRSRIPEEKFGLRLVAIACFVLGFILGFEGDVKSVITVSFLIGYSFVCVVRLSVVRMAERAFFEGTGE